MNVRTGFVLGVALLLTSAAARAETVSEEPPAYTALDEESAFSLGNRPTRLGLGLLGGALGGAAVAGASVLGMCAASPSNGWCVLPGMMLGGVLAVTVGIPLGAWTTGYLLDGDGSFVATLGGTVAGSLAFYGIWSAMEASGGGISNTEVWFGYAALTLPLIGAALAYELTSSPSRKATQTERRRWSVAPSVLPGGGGLAMAGAF